MDKQHTLIFEEDSALAQLYASVLEHSGLVVHRANTLSDMQMLLGTFPISLIIANMPHDRNQMSDLLSLNALLKTKGTHLVIVSGDARNHLLCHSLEIPFYEKPLSNRTLIELAESHPILNHA